MLPTIHSNTISSYLMHVCAYNSFYIVFKYIIKIDTYRFVIL